MFAQEISLIGDVDNYCIISNTHFIESFQELADIAAGALGRHDELERHAGLRQALRRGRHQVVGLLAVYRNAPQPPHDATKREAEDAGLAHPAHIQSQRECHHQGVGQVPVAGVWRGNQHAALALGRQAAFHPPAGQTKKTDGQRLQDGVDHGGVENGALHGSPCLVQHYRLAQGCRSGECAASSAA